MIGTAEARFGAALLMRKMVGPLGGCLGDPRQRDECENDAQTPARNPLPRQKRLTRAVGYDLNAPKEPGTSEQSYEQPYAKEFEASIPAN